MKNGLKGGKSTRERGPFFSRILYAIHMNLIMYDKGIIENNKKKKNQSFDISKSIIPVSPS